MQCTRSGVPVQQQVELAEIKEAFDVVLDGIFGFSFDAKRPLRSPFDTLLPAIKASGLPVVAIDIPSGWDVEGGNTSGNGLEAETLISLTAPKLCARHFKGRHYLSGRFVPQELAEKYRLNLPEYPGLSLFVELSNVDSACS